MAQIKQKLVKLLISLSTITFFVWAVSGCGNTFVHEGIVDNSSELAANNPSTNVTCTAPANKIIDPMKDCAPAAVCDGVTDDGKVFEAAMKVVNQIGGTLLVPPRTCLVNKTLDITNSDVSINCAGDGKNCKLFTSVANLPQITAKVVFPGVMNITVRGILLHRLVKATAGGDGINFSGWVDNGIIDSVTVYSGYNGIVLGACSFSWLKSSFVANSVVDNIVYQPNSGSWGNQTQWNMMSVESGGAGRFGIYVTTDGAYSGGYHGIIVGAWHNIETFVNGYGSVYVYGSNGFSVNDMRVTNSWFCCSTTGNEVYLNTNGGVNNSFDSSTIELSNGYGMAIDSTSTEVRLTSVKFTGNQKSGLLSYSPHLVMSNVIATVNVYHGFEIAGGSATISSIASYQNWGYGLYTSVDALYMSGGDLSGNASGAFYSTVGLSNSRICAVNGISGLNLCK